MTWKEYREIMKEEWQFHKRNPEMLVVFGVYVFIFVYLIFTMKWE
jgi:hypothetical protein